MQATNKTYSLADLKNWDFCGTSLCLLGHPIEHSLSPIMHNAALAEMAKMDPRFLDWKYFKFDIPPQHLGEALKLCYLKGFLGINLTLPHKVDAIRMIVSIDEVAKKMEAVNSLIYETTGYRGFNTDGYGLEAAIKYGLGVSIKGKKVILLGAGGAAKAAAVQCLLAECSELWIGNRTLERLDDLLKALGILGRGKVFGFSMDQIPSNLPKTGLLINATALGMSNDDCFPVDLDYFDSSLKVYDMVYKFGMTKFVRTANERQMRASDGLRMLVEQGARSLQVWTQQKVPIDVMWQAITNAIKLANDNYL